MNEPGPSDDPNTRCNRTGDGGRIEHADIEHMSELHGLDDEYSTEETHG
jgi:hypothetical protein